MEPAGVGGSLRTFWGTSGSVSTAPSELLILSLQKKIATASWVGARLKRRIKRVQYNKGVRGNEEYCRSLRNGKRADSAYLKQ